MEVCKAGKGLIWLTILTRGLGLQGKNCRLLDHIGKILRKKGKFLCKKILFQIHLEQCKLRLDWLPKRSRAETYFRYKTNNWTKALTLVCWIVSKVRRWAEIRNISAPTMWLPARIATLEWIDLLNFLILRIYYKKYNQKLICIQKT